MAIQIDGNTLVTVRAVVTDSAGDPISNTTAVEIPLKDLLVAALESIDPQSTATATVADLVTAVKLMA